MALVGRIDAVRLGMLNITSQVFLVLLQEMFGKRFGRFGGGGGGAVRERIDRVA